MSKITRNSRSILEYRPDINFIEPDVVSEKPVFNEIPDPNLGKKKLKNLQVLAKKVEELGEATQKKADKLAEGLCVDLDKTTDYNTVMAMRRHFPEDNPFSICYEQYKECKEHLREVANGVSNKMMKDFSEEVVGQDFKKLDKAFSGGDIQPLIDAITPDKITRPEDDKTMELIEPLDVAEFQDTMLRHLANLLWKKFVKPVIPLPPGISFLPDEIAPLPEGSASPEQMMGQEEK